MMRKQGKVSSPERHSTHKNLLLLKALTLVYSRGIKCFGTSSITPTDGSNR